MTFARESFPFVLPVAALAAASALLGWGRISLAAALAAGALLLFFRVPRRVTRGGPDAVLAPANGRVTRVDAVSVPELGGERYQRIVTFLSLLDVHVQRAPVAGRVVVSSHTAGRRVAAFRADADQLNENHLTVIRRSDGDLIGVRQIAGLLARRVVCYLDAEREVDRGQLMGLIKFGSRVDLLVPASYRLEVRCGQRLKEGATPVAAPGGRA